jgi:hypothetical protein
MVRPLMALGLEESLNGSPGRYLFDILSIRPIVGHRSAHGT